MPVIAAGAVEEGGVRARSSSARIAAASWPISDSTSLVTLPSGPGPAAGDGAVGAAQVEHRHRLAVGDVAADAAGAAGEPLGVGVERRDERVAGQRHAAAGRRRC